MRRLLPGVQLVRLHLLPPPLPLLLLLGIEVAPAAVAVAVALQGHVGEGGRVSKAPSPSCLSRSPLSLGHRCRELRRSEEDALKVASRTRLTHTSSCNTVLCCNREKAL